MNELFRRAAPGLAVAGVALASVWMFDPALHPAAGTDLAAAAASSDTTTSTGSDESSGTGSSGSDSTATDSSGSEGSAGASSSDCGSGTTTETGDQAMTRWGPVQVQMTFAADGTVCSVEAVSYPQNDMHSARLNAMAVPTLDARATSDGVSFDAVSGATYTSEAYRESMQSILDRM